MNRNIEIMLSEVAQNDGSQWLSELDAAAVKLAEAAGLVTVQDSDLNPSDKLVVLTSTGRFVHENS